MKTLFIIASLPAILVHLAESFPVADRQERQWSSYLPTSVWGMHQIPLGPFGKVELGVNDDGSIGLGLNLTLPVSGVKINGHADVGASLSKGIGFHADGGMGMDNEMLGIHAKMAGGAEGGMTGSGKIHGSGNGMSDVNVAGIGSYHTGMNSGVGLGMGENGGLAGEAGLGGAGGAVVTGVGGLGGDFHSEVAGTAGLTGVSALAKGGASVGGNILGVGAHAEAAGGAMGVAGINGIGGKVEGLATAGATAGASSWFG